MYGLTAQEDKQDTAKQFFTHSLMIGYQWSMQYACKGNEYNINQNQKSALYITPTKPYRSKPAVFCYIIDQ